MLCGVISCSHCGHPRNLDSHHENKQHGKVSVWRCNGRKISCQSQNEPITADFGGIQAGNSFCLSCGEEAESTICFTPRYQLCKIHVCIRNFQTSNRAVLQRCGDGTFSEHEFFCSGSALFILLPPGEYALTLSHSSQQVRFLLSLSPGANIDLTYDFRDNRYQWDQDYFRYPYNSPDLFW